MYSSKIIQLNLEVAQRELSFDLECSSIAKVDTYVTHLNSLINLDRWREKRELEFRDDERQQRLLRGESPFEPDEEQWIKNEKTIATFDYSYFATRYSFITDSLGKGLVHYQPNIAQRILNDIRAEMEELYLAICLFQLKARQAGISTDNQVALAQRVLFWPDTHVLTASSDPEKTSLIHAKMELVFEHMPYWMFPKGFIQRRSGEHRISGGELRTAVTLQHGNQESGIMRGDTVICGHLCLAPTTLIRLANGIVKPINAVKVGDSTITSLGRLSRIVDVGITRWRNEESTTDIRLWGNYNRLSVTKDHPILTPSGYRQAQELKKGDEVSIAVRPIIHSLERFTVHCRPRGSSRFGTTIEQSYKLNREMGWFLGLFAAEGSLKYNPPNKDSLERPCGFTISCDFKEVNDYYERLSRIFSNNHISIARSKLSRSVNMCISNNGMAEWLSENLYAEFDKTLPDWMWTCGVEFCKGVVEGYIKGDGHRVPNKNEITIVSTRLSLLIQIRDLIASLGYGWSSLTYLRAGVWHGRNCKERWDLHVCGIVAKSLCRDLGWRYMENVQTFTNHWKFSIDNKFIYIKVREVSEGYSEKFWYLTVEAKEHDFTTLHCCVANTEMEDWLHPDEDIDSSLIKAMHFTPETYLCMEFTAKWIDSYMHKKWKRAEEYYPQGKYRFRPFFLPWFLSFDIYPTPTEVRQYFEPIRTTWKPQPITIAQALRAEESVRSNPLYQKYLSKNWKMPLEQMWFWEWDREQAKIDGRLGAWICEMPSSSAEAWQPPGTSIFDTELIHDLRNHAKQPQFAFDVSGDEITPRMRPQGVAVDKSLPPIPVKFQSANFNGDYWLTPVRVEDWETFNPHGKLIVWELPQEDEEYYFSLDAGEGVEQDNTVCDVLRKGDGIRPDEQVAQFASNHISGDDFDPIALAIGAFYSVLWNGRDLKQPQFIPELAKGGKECLNKMRMKGWRNFYVHVPPNLKVRDASKVSTLGWPTNEVTRAEVVGGFIKAARERGDDQYLQINSRWTINEMATFGINPRKRKLEALGGAKDDRIFGLALPHWAAHVFQLRGKGETPWERRRKQQEAEDKQIVEYSFGDMARIAQRDIWRVRNPQQPQMEDNYSEAREQLYDY